MFLIMAVHGNLRQTSAEMNIRAVEAFVLVASHAYACLYKLSLCLRQVGKKIIVILFLRKELHR